MHAKYFLVHDSGHRKAVEAIRERFPKLDVISSLAFISFVELLKQRIVYSEVSTFVIEAVDSVDGRTLVIASQDKKILWVFNFIG